jgi:hypothetical protein
MVLRWTAASVLEAEHGFRKLRLSCDAGFDRCATRNMILNVPDRELTKLRKPLN